MGVLEILCKLFKVTHNVLRRIDFDRQIRFQQEHNWDRHGNNDGKGIWQGTLIP